MEFFKAVGSIRNFVVGEKHTTTAKIEAKTNVGKKTTPATINNSTDLQQFLYNNQYTSLDFIYAAGKYLAQGDYSTLETLLNFWPNNSTNYDRAYYEYFNILTNYYNYGYEPDLTLVHDFADACPLKYGSIVYAWRNLYNSFTNTVNMFDDGCTGSNILYGNNNKTTTSDKPAFVRVNQPKQIVAEQPITNSLTVYPNPATKYVNISSIKLVKNFTITDLMGRVVVQREIAKTNSIQINIAALRKGIYIIRVNNIDNTTVTQKLIVE